MQYTAARTYNDRQCTYAFTFHNNDCIIVEALKHLLDCPLVVASYLVVTLELSLWPWQWNISQFWLLYTYGAENDSTENREMSAKKSFVMDCESPTTNMFVEHSWPSGYHSMRVDVTRSKRSIPKKNNLRNK